MSNRLDYLFGDIYVWRMMRGARKFLQFFIKKVNILNFKDKWDRYSVPLKHKNNIDNALWTVKINILWVYYRSIWPDLGFFSIRKVQGIWGLTTMSDYIHSRISAVRYWNIIITVFNNSWPHIFIKIFFIFLKKSDLSASLASEFRAH